jgi:hypothetical protein
MGASYRLLKTFGTWLRYTWRRGSPFLSVFTNNPTPPAKLGISLCGLAIYEPTALAAIPSHLCILYLVFHTNISFLI